MTNIKKMENPKPILITVEKEEYEKFIASLPRTKAFSEAIREYIKSVNDEGEKIKNLSSPNYSAIQNELISYETTTNKPNIYNNSLDIYLLPDKEIVNYLDRIEDIHILAQIEIKSRIFHNIAKKRKLEKLPLEKLRNEQKQKWVYKK